LFAQSSAAIDPQGVGDGCPEAAGFATSTVTKDDTFCTPPAVRHGVQYLTLSCRPSSLGRTIFEFFGPTQDKKARNSAANGRALVQRLPCLDANQHHVERIGETRVISSFAFLDAAGHPIAAGQK